jgi:hypothetical protein
LKPGRVLSPDDVKDLQEGYNRRDGQIEMYQCMEERLGRELENLRSYLGEVLAAIKAPILGYAQQVGDSSGLFHDGWVAREVSLQLRAERPVTGVVVKGFVPEHFPKVSRAFEIEIDGKRLDFSLEANTAFEFFCPADIRSGEMFPLRLRCNSDFNASAAGQGGDQRNLAYGLSAIELLHEPVRSPKPSRRKAG